ncbi:MAG: hypothetical protein R3Y29_01965 [bacterium]
MPNYEEKVYDFTKDTPGKYLLSNKYLVSLILYGVISKDLGGLTLSEIFDMLPSSEEDDNYVETLSKEFGGFESKLTERDIIFKLDVNISSLSKVLNINLELERSIQDGYDLVNRALIYACQNLLSTTQGKNYDDINKTYSIWICMKNHITQKEPVKDENSPFSFIHKYCMGKKEDNSDNITYNKRVDKINLVFIELGEIVKNKENFIELDSENDDIKMLIEYLSILFREQTKSELDTTISELSQSFEGKELTCKGVGGMTSRLYTIAELEDAKLQAEENAVRAEEDKKILRLLVSGKSMEEVSIKKNVSEEYIKSLLEDK